MKNLIWIILAVVGFRFLFGVSIQLNIKGKKLQKTCAQAPLWDKWFLWTAHKLCVEKYSKYEKRRIDYSIGAKVFFVANIINHVVLLSDCIFLWIFFQYTGDFCADDFLRNMDIIHISGIVGELIIISAINVYENKRKHKDRLNRKF